MDQAWDQGSSRRRLLSWWADQIGMQEIVCVAEQKVVPIAERQGLRVELSSLFGYIFSRALKICPGMVKGLPKTNSALVHFKSCFTVLRSASMTKGSLSTQVRPLVDAIRAYFNCL